MSGVLGEIAAAKSLAEDLYNFAYRLKNARVDIGDLDVKLRNDRLLLLRYYGVISRRLPLLRDSEVNHLCDYFQAISRVLLDCVKKIKNYEKHSSWGRSVWCVLGKEVQECETKVATWIGGLMNWAVVIDADQRTPTNVPYSAHQYHSHLRMGFHNVQQAILSDNSSPGTFGHRKLLEQNDHAGASYGSTSTRRIIAQSGAGDAADKVESTISLTAGMTITPPQQSTQKKTIANRTLSDLKPSSRNSELIATGAFGDIYKVGSKRLVCKVPRESNANSFKNEATVLKKLSHKQHDHIIQLINTWEEGGNHILLLPLAQGDLRSLLMNIAPIPGNHTEQWLSTQMTGLANACNIIHEGGFRHQDIKPENILIFYDEDKGSSRWALSDFGISHDSSDKTSSGGPQEASSSSRSSKKPDSMFSRGGTDLYFPPEIWESHHDFTAGDMWSLGCVFLETLAWYLKPEGYSPQNFHHSRVQTLRDDGSPQEKQTESARFWAADHRGRPLLHTFVKETLDNIKNLAIRSDWLLDIPYHIERLLSIKPETRYSALELDRILQHGLTLKKMALGDNPGPYAILNGGPLPKSKLMLDLPAEPPANAHIAQEEILRRQSVNESSSLPQQQSFQRSTRNERNQSLRKRGRWTQNEIRSRYLKS